VVSQVAKKGWRSMELSGSYEQKVGYHPEKVRQDKEMGPKAFFFFFLVGFGWEFYDWDY
jgi:hypothetical protein